MARDILSEFGPESPNRQAARATCGDAGPAKDVMNYEPPVGPIGIHRAFVGLGGANLGNAGSQGKSSLYGDGGAGAPGIDRLGGVNKGKGTNRG